MAEQWEPMYASALDALLDLATDVQLAADLPRLLPDDLAAAWRLGDELLYATRNERLVQLGGGQLDVVRVLFVRCGASTWRTVYHDTALGERTKQLRRMMRLMLGWMPDAAAAK